MMCNIVTSALRDTVATLMQPRPMAGSLLAQIIDTALMVLKPRRFLYAHVVLMRHSQRRSRSTIASNAQLDSTVMAVKQPY